METGTQSPTTETAFHADDAQQVAEYRTVSALAVVSLVFGLLSPVCFASPIFMAIPLFGIGLSILALNRIASSDGALVGRWAATAGLALCVISITAALSRDRFTQFIRTSQAEDVARQWIELLLASDTEQAFRLTAAAHRSAPPPPGPSMPEPSKTPKEAFLEDPLIAELTGAGPDAEIRLIETMNYNSFPGRQFIVQQKFHVERHTTDGARSEPIELIVELSRSKIPRELQSRWLVGEFESPQLSSEVEHVH